MAVKKKILFVDDDQTSIDQFKFDVAPKFKGYEFLYANNRAEAAALIKNCDFDEDKPSEQQNELLALALIDQNLDDFGEGHWFNEKVGAEGLSLASFIASNVSELTRIALFTAHKGTEADEGFDAAKLGADAYWSKSMTTTELVKQIQQQLKRFDHKLKQHDRKLLG